MKFMNANMVGIRVRVWQVLAVLTDLFISNLHPKVLQNCILVQIRVMVYLWENVLVGIIREHRGGDGPP